MTSSSTPDLACSQRALARSRHLRQASTWWAGRAGEIRRESRRLRQHAHVLHERSQPLRQRYLLVVCAWCTKRLRWQPLLDPVALTVSAPPVARPCCVSWERACPKNSSPTCAHSVAFQEYTRPCGYTSLEGKVHGSAPPRDNFSD
jgi:hypothetical protein